MKCHYEVLGLERDASDEDIKKSYRKLALKWHPDKNLENPAEAKEQFQLIQQAYDILIDPQERSWYDNHREAILKGGLGEDFKDDSIDLFKYFTTTCYKSYTDAEDGFYTVYRKVFQTLADEDAKFAKDIDSDDEPPGFGDSMSPYENDVHDFYAYWQSYSTKRNYAWLDPYDIREAPNRRVQRLVEKENKKIREKARKERNEQVRSLVAFVRKRDKRVQAHAEKLAEKARLNSLKAQERKRQMLLDRKRELQSQGNSADWTKFSNIESQLKNMEADLAAKFGEKQTDEEDENLEKDALYCVACNKVFKKKEAFANHEKSKKHRENLLNLKRAMKSEEIDSGNEGNSNNEKNSEESSDLDSNDSEDTTRKDSEEKTENSRSNVNLQGAKSKDSRIKKSKRKSKKIYEDSDDSDSEHFQQTKDKKISQSGATGPEMPDFLLDPPKKICTENDETSEGELYSDEDDSDEISEKKKLSNGDKMPAGNEKGPENPLDGGFLFPETSKVKQGDEDEETSSGELISDQEDNEEKIILNSKKKKKKPKSVKKVIEEPESSEEDIELGLSKKQRKKRRNLEELMLKKETNDLQESTEVLVENSDKPEVEAKTPRTKGKKAKELRKNRKEKEDKEPGKSMGKSKSCQFQDIEHRCVTCKVEFSSKNKLFEHLKKTGHSVYLPQAASKSKKKEKKSKPKSFSESDS